MGLFSSIFGSKTEQTPEEKQINKNFDILKYDGIRARNIGQICYAIKCFEQACNLKEEAETMRFLAQAYLQSGRLEEAQNLLAKLTTVFPEQTEDWMLLAQVCFMNEDYATMKTASQKAIEMDSENATGFLLNGKAEKGLNNPLQALAMFTKAILLKEDFQEAYLLRAEILWSMKQTKDAQEDLDKLLTLNPHDEEALLLKGRIEVALGNIETAHQLFDTIIDENPFNEKAYLLKGTLYMEQKDFDKSIETFSQGIELIPNSSILYQERGRAKLLKGDKDGSWDDMKTSLELNPEANQQINGNYNNFETPAKNIPW